MVGNMNPYSYLSVLTTVLSRSILHDPKVYNNSMEFQPERYLKDGKLDPNVRDPDCAAFGFGRRSVDPVFASIYMLMLKSYPVYVLEDT
jgi:Cytochrome P450